MWVYYLPAVEMPYQFATGGILLYRSTDYEYLHVPVQSGAGMIVSLASATKIISQ